MQEMMRKQNAVVLINGQYPDKVLSPHKLSNSSDWTKIHSLKVSSNSIGEFPLWYIYIINP